MAVGLEGQDRTEISVSTYGQCPRCLVLFSYRRAHLIESSTTENSLLHRCHYHLPKHCKETALSFHRMPIPQGAHLSLFQERSCKGKQSFHQADCKWKHLRVWTLVCAFVTCDYE